MECPALARAHIAPKSMAGSDKISNAVLVCRTCNREKGSKPRNAWLDEEKAAAKDRKAKKDSVSL